jgi:hypothetical protein
MKQTLIHGAGHSGESHRVTVHKSAMNQRLFHSLPVSEHIQLVIW